MFGCQSNMPRPHFNFHLQTESIAGNNIPSTTTYSILSRSTSSHVDYGQFAFPPNHHPLTRPQLTAQTAETAASMSKPMFWSTPLRYLRWAANERPAIFYSILMGSMGPVALVTLPRVRKYFGDVDPAPVPMSYPSTLEPFLRFHDDFSVGRGLILWLGWGKICEMAMSD